MVERPRLYSGMAKEVMEYQDFGLIVAPGPPIVFTARNPQAPAPVEDTQQRICSTVGIVAYDSKHRHGITTALHAIGDETKVIVEGKPDEVVTGNVVSTDHVTDSCFIELLDYSPFG